MIILLVNDDGIESKKLKMTEDMLRKYATVYTVAPKAEQSGKGMAISIGGFPFEKIDDFHYAVDGTPVDCVNFGLGALGLRPDIIVSGTNDGYNLGFDTRYSGTVGACLQGQYFGFPTIAFSSDRNGFRMMEEELEKTFYYILENELHSPEYTLNVNFPREKFDETKGILHTKLHYQKFEYNPEIKNGRYMPNRRLSTKRSIPQDTDAYAFAMGYTSISKITI